jgi:SIR2-like protein
MLFPKATSAPVHTMPMPSKIESSVLGELKAAFAQKKLALYLGAGVSLGSGLPSWNQLVLAMYFSAISEDWKGMWRPYPNYLYAISEWQLNRLHEPLEITARKIRQYYSDDSEFLNQMRSTLYAGFDDQGPTFWQYPNIPQLRLGNPTLDGIASLCEKSTVSTGIKAIVSYNYDSLVETVLMNHESSFIPVWKSSATPSPHQHPVIHVHGYIPPFGKCSPLDEIIFTEQQYHAAAHSPYSWSNLSQIQCLASSVGLMIGLSLSDRNMRRLLDAIKVTPLSQRQYALLKKPAWNEPKPQELEEIHANAVSYIDRFARSGAKKSGSDRNEQMLTIFQELNRHEEANYTKLLLDLGITPIWYSMHEEVGSILMSIIQT